MDLFFSCSLYLLLSALSSAIIFLVHHHKSPSRAKLPPGRKGWSIIGETMELALAAQGGSPERFMIDRMSKYSPEVFRTFLMDENMAVMCGAAGNKFLFSNENKLVTSWWHRSMKKILYFPSIFDNPAARDHVKTPSFIPEFLGPESQKHYVGIMDLLAGVHIDRACGPDHGEVIKVVSLARKYAFALSCRLFMNLEDPDCVSRICDCFEQIMAGFFSLPLDIPGTAFNRAIRASNAVHGELLAVIRRRRKTGLGHIEGGDSSAATDLLSRMLLETDERGEEHFSDEEMSTHLICLLLVSTDSTKQMEIAKSKGPQEHLNWNDIQRMRYSTWNVVNETMRLNPPVQGAFREAITDFSFAGFTIPKGWKTHWNVNTTHKNPKYFRDPEKFDPSRFEGRGPEPFTFVPSGGGPRMCPGREYARAEILVFVHNIVTKFKWERVYPHEKVSYNPSPTLAKGFPVRLHRISHKN